MDAIDISLVVPTLNEAENLGLLVPRIAAALAGRSYEILIVDDNSRDATPAVCEELAKQYPVRLVVRTHPTNGLSGAVLHGFSQARGRMLGVMDADLQHPPEKLPELFAPLVSGEADFTIGSRYVSGGSTGQKWGLFRQVNSRVATLLARPFAGRISDPMSGFFALRRETFDAAQKLTPLGYKIALELMCKCRVKNVREIPIHFAERQHGESKLSLKQQFKYLEHLSRLYDFTFPRASPILKFLITLVASWFVGFGVYAILIRADTDPFAATVPAYVMALAVTTVFHVRYVRTQREFLLTRRPWMDFVLISVVELFTVSAAAWWLSRRVGDVHPIEVFFIVFGCATVVRYILRKEFMQDIRGLRRDARKDELT